MGPAAHPEPGCRRTPHTATLRPRHIPKRFARVKGRLGRCSLAGSPAPWRVAVETRARARRGAGPQEDINRKIVRDYVRTGVPCAVLGDLLREPRDGAQ